MRTFWRQRLQIPLDWFLIAIATAGLLVFSLVSESLRGTVFGNNLRHPCKFLFDFMETTGQLFMFVIFLILTGVFLPERIAHVIPAIGLYVVLSLTVVRMVPIGSRARTPTQLFLCWFGPVGSPSMLFVSLIQEGSIVPHREELLVITVITVALGALLHSISAAPHANAHDCLAVSMANAKKISLPWSSRFAAVT